MHGRLSYRQITFESGKKFPCRGHINRNINQFILYRGKRIQISSKKQGHNIKINENPSSTIRKRRAIITCKSYA